jgi:DNA polymerase (family 10)
LDNHAIARIFREMSELTEIEGGDPHRARAFATAARVLEELRAPVEHALADGSLARRRGLGEGTIGRLKEILRTGTCRSHRELVHRVPTTLREMLPIVHVGPRTARIAWQSLGVTTLDGLLEAARDGRLAQAPGFTEASAAEVKDAIEAHRQKPPRLLWHEAQAAAQPLLDALHSSGLVSDVTLVGSFRRRKPTVGDLDLVAGAADPEALVNFFTSLDIVTRVLMRGNDRARVRLKNGHKSDLWIVPPDVFGAGILAFTSAAPHNIALRMRATKMGMHLSEYGLLDPERRRRAAPTTTETEVYRALGLPFIPPELREGRGEIDAALTGRLPMLVEDAALKADLGCHPSGLTTPTVVSVTACLDESARAARERGLHDVVVLLDENVFDLDVDALTSARTHLEGAHGVNLTLAACVPLIDDDCVLRLDELRQKAEWVVVTAPRPAPPAPVLTTRILKALATGAVDALLAPTGRGHVLAEQAEIDHPRVAQVARLHEVALLIAGEPTRVDPDDVTMRLYVDAGVTVGVATDAPPAIMHDALAAGVACLRRAWAPVEQVLNVRHKEAWPRPPVRRGASSANMAPSGDLADSLLQRPLSAEVRVRIERFLIEGRDAELERALASRGENVLQAAFALLVDVE